MAFSVKGEMIFDFLLVDERTSKKVTFSYHTVIATSLKAEFLDIYSSSRELEWVMLRARDLENQDPSCIYKSSIV